MFCPCYLTYMVGPSTSSAMFIIDQNLTNDVYQNTRYHDFKNLHPYKYTRSHLCSTCNSLSNKPAPLPSHVSKSVIVKALASAMWHGLCPLLYWRKEQHCTAPWPPSATRTISDDQSRLVCPFIYDDFKNTAITTIRSYDQHFRKKISIPNFISNYISTLRWRISVLMKICFPVGFCAA
jgi:hypothetical protein